MQFVIFLYLSKKSTKLKADEPEKTKIFIMKTTKPDLEKPEVGKAQLEAQSATSAIA